MFDELADEDTKAELIDGVMIVHSPASIEHDDLSGFIRALMSFYVEVLSPSNRDEDLQDKRYVYQAAGVGEIWFVDPEHQQVILDRRQADSYTEAIVTEGKISSMVIANFWIPASWLWAKPLPNRLVCLQDILSAT